ncbi:colicin immunity domain-containing protein [Phocoenobacter skyensis]|uniref:Colicin immunity domain-containing protein n=1 Tax=Phocoenobacter skyensis TaxID=97481 RepID=A0ABT9JID1_9PAST|nr:colicin immunity domain-containing protein [Pasteurella skyensis]MDP8078344.1 colicin immunity domain-containing protein [Pasteurella skyensis]MDP8084564.1 colicin immunity domain-containing protein [Pasteurella skyensis]
MVTPLIQLAIDFDKGKLSAVEFADKYIDLWFSDDQALGQNDEDTFEVASAIGGDCELFCPDDEERLNCELDEVTLRKNIRKYLSEINS